jgi:hypothetical protein
MIIGFTYTQMTVPVCQFNVDIGILTRLILLIRIGLPEADAAGIGQKPQEIQFYDINK